MMILTESRERTRFFRFAVVGAIGTVIDFAILNFLHLVFHFPVLLANLCSFTIAVFSNFTLNRYWTYPDSRSKPLQGQLLQFLVVNAFGWGINTLVLWSLLGISTQVFGRYGYNVAKAGATVVSLFWNFFINRYWTYNDVK
jgi:putative flippase GtrA